MHTNAFFNAALRGAFAASASAVAYARQLLHVRYDAERDDCKVDDEDALKWGLLDDVKTVPGPTKKKADSNIRFKCTLTEEVRHKNTVAPNTAATWGHVVHHVFRASCLTHVSVLFLLPSQDMRRLGYCDGQGFLWRRRTKIHKNYYFMHPSLLDREQGKIDMTAAWKANDNDLQLQHFPASVSVDLSQLCPTSPADDGEPRHKQWALRQASWEVNVVDGFPTRDHCRSDEWLPDDSPEWPSEDSDDYLSVLAARFLRLLDEYACLDGSGFKENLQVYPLLCSPHPDRPHHCLRFLTLRHLSSVLRSGTPIWLVHVLP